MEDGHSTSDLEVAEITQSAEHIQIESCGEASITTSAITTPSQANSRSGEVDEDENNQDEKQEEEEQQQQQQILENGSENQDENNQWAQYEEEVVVEKTLEEMSPVPAETVATYDPDTPIVQISRGRGVNSSWSIHSPVNVQGRGRGRGRPNSDDGLDGIPSTSSASMGNNSNNYAEPGSGPCVRRIDMDKLGHRNQGAPRENGRYPENGYRNNDRYRNSDNNDRDQYRSTYYNSRGRMQTNQMQDRRRSHHRNFNDNSASGADATQQIDDENCRSSEKESIGSGLQRVLAEGEKGEAQREVYIPASGLRGEAMFQGRNQRYKTGLNFDAYGNIPIRVDGDNKKSYNIRSFEDFGYRDILLDNISKLNYKTPTPIQKSASPLIMDGIDVMACAQTGSGKTAAFLLPIMNTLLNEQLCGSDHPTCLIVAPTRELAKQIHTEADLYSHDTAIKTRSAYGGVAQFHQRNALRRGVDILVGTPGRLLHFIDQQIVKLDHVKYFVLDEADIMMDMGFMPDIRRIIFALPPKTKRVSAMFSATFPNEIQKAAKEYLRNYVFVAIGTVGGACGDIKQIVYQVDRADKRRKLREVFNDISPEEKVLIFCSKKQNVDYLAAHLSTLQIKATSIHGDRLQSQRELALNEFIDGTRQVLVATSVAARGLDIPKVSVVINYEMPADIEEYIHRIGRTGRVGNIGKSISFFDPYQDRGIAPKLASTLKNAEQEVPDWLEKFSSYDANDENATFGSRRFAATDYRKHHRGFNGMSGVPEPVEDDADDDDWS